MTGFVLDHPVLHHQHPVGQLHGFLDVVGHQQNGAPVQHPQVGDERLRGEPGQRVQCGERLVEQEQVRFPDERTGQ